LLFCAGKYRLSGYYPQSNEYPKMHPITFILFIAALFISVALEIIIVKKFAGKIGIEKEAKWIEAVLISTAVSVVATYIIGHTVVAFLIVLLMKLSVHLPPFVHFIPNILIPIILRIFTYSYASPTWKILSFKKKLLFCCCACGLVNVVSIFLAYLIVMQINYNENA
jgi:hypothetical protein